MARETEALELSPAAVERGVKAVFADSARGTYYLAERRDGAGSEVVGCLLITPEWSDWRNGWIWWLQSVYVVQHARRQGVLRAMYRHVQSLAGRSGRVVGLRLYVDGRNRRAQSAYRALGMEGGHYRVFEAMLPPEGRQHPRGKP